MLKLNREVPIENLISRQIKFWQKEQKKTPEKYRVTPNLTISKQPGSRAMEVAESLNAILKWQIYDKELVDYIANNSLIRKDMVEIFDEKTRTEMDEFFATFLNHKTISKETYFKQLVKTISTIAKLGNSIIVGRGGNFILPDTSAFKVCFVEDFKDRQTNLSRANAGVLISEKQINKRDQERSDFFKRYFNSAVDDPTHFDIVINLSRCANDAAEKIILSGMKAKFKMSCDALKL